ncbi:hypothetical protein HYU06_01635 [Candidatus Woesearchaeota archaeon]|nr:hypothetical protein [Candidatus Woesearchaeota archaeon]
MTGGNWQESLDGHVVDLYSNTAKLFVMRDQRFEAQGAVLVEAIENSVRIAGGKLPVRFRPSSMRYKIQPLTERHKYEAISRIGSYLRHNKDYVGLSLLMHDLTTILLGKGDVFGGFLTALNAASFRDILNQRDLSFTGKSGYFTLKSPDEIIIPIIKRDAVISAKDAEAESAARDGKIDLAISKLEDCLQHMEQVYKKKLSREALALALYLKSNIGLFHHLSGNSRLAVESTYNPSAYAFDYAIRTGILPPSIMHSNLAEFLIGVNDMHGASGQADVAIKMLPENPEAYIAMAKIHLKNGQYSDAMMNFAEALFYSSSNLAEISDYLKKEQESARIKLAQTLKKTSDVIAFDVNVSETQRDYQALADIQKIARVNAEHAG